ncbi:MAG: YihA family ribosome biogenesis GTP-binding protein [Bacteroidetes bacterium]|nr:YihA family ribosome biogenesis GTP-binding protein [Bacteroidota bacterium]
MQTLDIDYTGSYPRVDDCPAPGAPEFAFIGRSNVGKSSLINMLSGRKALAKVSRTPGKTQTLNYFWTPEGWFLVDLPGYGYAKVSKAMRKHWEGLIRNYLIRRPSLAMVFLLIDGSIPPQQNDLDFTNFLGESRVPFAHVFTKTDRVPKTKRQAFREAFEEKLLETWEALPLSFMTSAEKRMGQDELLAYIRSIKEQLTAEAEGNA